MRISDWSSDVCSSDLDTPLSIRSRPCSHPPNALSISPFPRAPTGAGERPRDSGASPLPPEAPRRLVDATHQPQMAPVTPDRPKRRSHPAVRIALRSEEQTSELQSLMRISYAVFCLKTKQNRITIEKYTMLLSRN